MTMMRPADDADRRVRVQAVEQARRALDDAEAVADHLAGDATEAAERAHHARAQADDAEREARRLRWEAEVRTEDAEELQRRAAEARREVSARLAELRAYEQALREGA